MAKARRAKQQRGDAYTAVLAVLDRAETDCPWLITITRQGKRKLDDDNLASSAKHIRDGVADALGIDDGDPRLHWKYLQEHPLPYGAHVEMIGGGDVK